MFHTVAAHAEDVALVVTDLILLQLQHDPSWDGVVPPAVADLHHPAQRLHLRFRRAPPHVFSTRHELPEVGHFYQGRWAECKPCYCGS